MDDIVDMSELDFKKHRFGITYLHVGNKCAAADVDRILKASSKDKVQIAFLQSVILGERDEMPTSSLRDRMQSIDGDKPSPPRPAPKPAIRRMPSDLMQELQLKESIITEIQKEKDELVKTFDVEKQQLVTEMIGNFQQEVEKIKQEERKLRQDLERELATVKLQIEKNTPSDPFKNDISFWEVSHSDVKLTDENIGNGAWACVRKGFFKEQPVAVKCVHKNIVSSHTISLLKREVAMMAKIRHPCLLLFIAVSFDHPSGSPMIITELMDCSFRDAYNKKGMLIGSSKIMIMIDVARALHYLHTHKDRILHRDVSSANVLIYRAASDTHRGKLSDFGSANIARHAVTAGPGAEIYMAPEVPRESRSMIHSAKQTTKIDVYSYGILLCEVFASEPQLPFMQVIKSMQHSIKSQFPFMHELIVKCTQHNPDARPEIINILCELKETFPNIIL